MEVGVPSGDQGGQPGGRWGWGIKEGTGKRPVDGGSVTRGPCGLCCLETVRGRAHASAS